MKADIKSMTLPELAAGRRVADGKRHRERAAQLDAVVHRDGRVVAGARHGDGERPEERPFRRGRDRQGRVRRVEDDPERRPLLVPRTVRGDEEEVVRSLRERDAGQGEGSALSLAPLPRRGNAPFETLVVNHRGKRRWFQIFRVECIKFAE